MALNDILTSMDGARDALVTAINAKGGSLADNATLYQCADAVGSLSGGTSAEYYKCASVTPGVSEAVIEVTGDTVYTCNGTYTIVDATATGKARKWRTSDGAWEIRNTKSTLGIDRWVIWDIASDAQKILMNMSGTVPDNPWEVPGWKTDSPTVYLNLVLTPTDSTNTWSGYKAVFDSGTGTWSFESDVTAGLTYTSVTPIVGGIYSADALVTVSMLYDGTVTLPGCVFYAELKDATVSLKSGQTLTIPDSAVFQNVAGVPCVQINGTDQITFTPENLPSGNVPRTYCFWNYITSTPPGGTFFGSKPSSYGNGMYYQIEYYNSGYNFTFGGNAPFSNATAPLNQWNFVAVTYNGNGVYYLYVNKTKYNPSNSNTLNTKLDVNYIGPIAGYYAKARIFDYALSETEIGYMVDNEL